MAWPGCNTTSEFVELLNFGPGPMNIGCYIVTNGNYSITIPPNTILQPKQYYVISGQDILASGCGNADSAIHVDLNWNAVNCTNVPIPATGDGFLKDGGNANEKIVLLDPNLNVVDAVSRDAVPSSSIPLTTNALSGGCTSKTFNLTTMGVAYESINNSTGINNSYARKVDGDCGWVKTPAISARAPNKTGNTSSASYEFSTLSAMECSGTTGTIAISVTAANVASLFPMNYTLAYDADGNNQFDGNDQYFYGVDSSAPAIQISNLAYGRYRITVATASGCNLKSYDFFIFNCYGIALSSSLLDFSYVGKEGDQHRFKCKVDDGSEFRSVVLESSNGGLFNEAATLNGPLADEFFIRTRISTNQIYRLRLTDKAGTVRYSKTIKVENGEASSYRFWKDEASQEFYVTFNQEIKGKVECMIMNATGSVMRKSESVLNNGDRTFSVDVKNLQRGIYFLRIKGAAINAPVTIKFVE